MEYTQALGFLSTVDWQLIANEIYGSEQIEHAPTSGIDRIRAAERVRCAMFMWKKEPNFPLTLVGSIRLTDVVHL